MVTGCLFLVMLAFLLSICTFLTWQNCCKGRYQWKKTLQPDTAIAELRFSKIRVTIVRQLSKTGWSHLLPLWDDPAPGRQTPGPEQALRYMKRAPPPGPGVMPTLQAAVAESVAGQQGGPDQPFRSAAHSLPGPRTIHECR